MSVTINGGNIITAGFEFFYGAAIFYFPNTASGCSTPTKTIVGNNVALNDPVSVAADNSGTLYVASSTEGSGHGAVNEYSSTASGNASPTTVLQGNNTKLNEPTEVYIDNSTTGAGRLLVSDSSGHVLVFAPGATGNATPVQDITSVSAPTGVATDSNGKIYVSAPGNSEIRVFAATATGAATPVNKVRGTASGLSAPGQLFIAPISPS
ncbi:MAG TPA: hypothetical protein VGF98_06095 [Candidatus Tumulicola sp.]|jgi:sugar lactone lactonase YvrE